jgi:glutamate-5-semialdehyde dehydrogenase
MDIQTYIESLCREAKQASVELRSVSGETKNRALLSIAGLMESQREEIYRANRLDCERGKSGGLSDSFLNRLRLDEKGVNAMIASLNEIAAMEDPVGERIGLRRPQGFILEKIRVPIGVVAMIYESRPNVTLDAAALCIKSGNSAVLRGGSEAFESNRALMKIIRRGLEKAGLSGAAVQLVERREYEGVNFLVKQVGSVDLVIPRGGEKLIRRVVDEATVPVIKHYKGVCHLYIDGECDPDMAVEVVYNAKVQRPATCNALETLLIHRDVCESLLPRVQERLQNVELRGCDRSRAILGKIGRAQEEDYYAEYLDLILAIRVVDDMDEAIKHIEKYGSSHTDGIISRNAENIERFILLVDSAVLTVNSSTRLSDGGVFGLGAEIGISTDKLHARGPMGLKELTTYKWVVRGRGDVRN